MRRNLQSCTVPRHILLARRLRLLTMAPSSQAQSHSTFWETDAVTPSAITQAPSKAKSRSTRDASAKNSFDATPTKSKRDSSTALSTAERSHLARQLLGRAFLSISRPSRVCACIGHGKLTFITVSPFLFSETARSTNSQIRHRASLLNCHFVKDRCHDREATDKNKGIGLHKLKRSGR